MTKHTRQPRTPTKPKAPRKKGDRSQIGKATALLAELGRMDQEALEPRSRAALQEGVSAGREAEAAEALERERWDVWGPRNRLTVLGMTRQEVKALEARAREVTSEGRVDIVLERAAKVREQTCEHDLAKKLHRALVDALEALDAMAKIDHVGVTDTHVGIEEACIGLMAHIQTMIKRVNTDSPPDLQQLAIEKARRLRSVAPGDLDGFSEIEKAEIIAAMREEEAEGIVDRLTYEELRVALDGHSAAALRSKRWRDGTPKRHARRREK